MGSNRRENLVNEYRWPYDRSETPSFPTIEVNIISPTLNVELQTSRTLRLKVDTGYAGQIMLSTDLYNQGFHLAELPEEKFGMYRTAAGPVEVKRARAMVRLPSLSAIVEGIVETPRRIHFDRNLAGRGLLQQFQLLLDGPKAESCLTLG